MKTMLSCQYCKKLFDMTENHECEINLIDKSLSRPALRVAIVKQKVEWKE